MCIVGQCRPPARLGAVDLYDIEIGEDSYTQMPTYDYVCDACGNRFEKFQSFKDDPIKVCPVCGKESARRVISAAGVIFKGSGWYINDSRKPAPAAKADSTDSKPDAVPATGDSKAADSTPAAPDSKPAATETKPAAEKKSEAA